LDNQQGSSKIEPLNDHTPKLNYRVVHLVNHKEYQTDIGLLKIVNLAYNMNLEGKPCS
jgi:hypothetical protein